MGIKVVIADDNLIAREGVERILALAPEVEVVASVGDLDELTAALDRERPDVVRTDIRMPPSLSDEGIRFANRLRDTHPGIGVIVHKRVKAALLFLSATQEPVAGAD